MEFISSKTIFFSQNNNIVQVSIALYYKAQF